MMVNTNHAKKRNMPCLQIVVEATTVRKKRQHEDKQDSGIIKPQYLENIELKKRQTPQLYRKIIIILSTGPSMSTAQALLLQQKSLKGARLQYSSDMSSYKQCFCVGF